MEYYQDLKYYYEDSYGHPLNIKTACRTLTDLYLHFRWDAVNISLLFCSFYHSMFIHSS